MICNMLNLSPKHPHIAAAGRTSSLVGDVA